MSTRLSGAVGDASISSSPSHSPFSGSDAISSRERDRQRDRDRDRWSSWKALLTRTLTLHMTYRKRLVTLLALFVFYIVQLALYQSHSRSAFSREHPRNAAFLATVDALLVVVSTVALSCGWVFRPYFENNIFMFNALIFGLSFGWLILAAPFAASCAPFYAINCLVTVFLIGTDVCAQLYVRPPLFSIKLLASKGSATYGKIRSSVDGAELRDEEDEVDIELANHRSRNNSSKGSNKSKFSEINDESSNDESDIVIRDNKVDITDRQVCEGFRVNFSRLPLGDKQLRRDLIWEDFLHIQHIVDSSSCHIYTALWRNKAVVLKLIKAERLSSAVAIAEFDIEENVLSRIRHPHVIRLLGSGIQPRKFLVLELLAGGSLAHSLGLRTDSNNQVGQKKRFSLLETFRLALSLAQALRYLHHEWSDSVHIIHRDLKPDNIGFTSDGNLKLFDFGLCTAVRLQRDRSEQFRLTGNTGTLRYMAPEVVLGRSYNQTVDVYSFGILIWQITTGKVPFREMGKKTFFDKVVVGGQRLKIDPTWPVSFSNLLRQCWHEDKLQRPTFKQVCIELEALLRVESDMLIIRRNRLDSRCFQQFNSSLQWLRPLTVLALILIFVASLATVVGSNDTVVGAALGTFSSFGIYAMLMSYLHQSDSNVPYPSRKRSLDVTCDNATTKDAETVRIVSEKVSSGDTEDFAFNPLNNKSKQGMTTVQ